MSVNPLQMMEIEELQSEHTRFQVTDLNSANWCLRKMAALNAKVAEVNQLADAEVERINDWRQREIDKVKSTADYLEMLLTDYHKQQLAADPKAKTISTPYGKLKSTTRKPCPKKVDEEKLLIFLQRSGDTQFIKVKESPDWSEYKKTLQLTEINGEWFAIDENGQKVAGVEVDLGGTSFSVEVSE